MSWNLVDLNKEREEKGRLDTLSLWMEEVFMEFMTWPIFDTFLYESDYPNSDS